MKHFIDLKENGPKLIAATHFHGFSDVMINQLTFIELKKKGILDYTDQQMREFGMLATRNENDEENAITFLYK